MKFFIASLLVGAGLIWLLINWLQGLAHSVAL